MTLEPMEAPRAANTDPRSEDLVAPRKEDLSRSAGLMEAVAVGSLLVKAIGPISIKRAGSERSAQENITNYFRFY